MECFYNPTVNHESAESVRNALNVCVCFKKKMYNGEQMRFGMRICVHLLFGLSFVECPFDVKKIATLTGVCHKNKPPELVLCILFKTCDGTSDGVKNCFSPCFR